jgi:hypothetical protein
MEIVPEAPEAVSKLLSAERASRARNANYLINCARKSCYEKFDNDNAIAL